jgi:integrase
MTISELGDFWLQQRETFGHSRRRGALKPQTIAAYANTLRLIVRPALGGVRVSEVSIGLLEGVLGDLEETGLSTAQARSTLHQMLGLAARHGAIGSNPMDLVSTPLREPREVEALDLDAVRELRRLAEPETQRRPGKRGPNRDLADFVDVALGTGCRIGEVLALRWCHLDLLSELPTAEISGTLVEPRHSLVAPLHRQESTKSNTNRTLVLPDHVVRVLHLRRSEAQHGGDGDPVFGSRTGTWLWPNNIRTRLRAATLGSPLSGTTPHTLRRTVGTHLTHTTNSLDAAREQLGHSNPGTTFQYYVARRATAPDLRRVLDAFFD